MSDAPELSVLLDQNVPREIVAWLLARRKGWQVEHLSDVGLDGRSDRDIFDWAQARGFLIVTFDEDFADRRAFPVGTHCGVVRLRVWPTTVENTRRALERLLAGVREEELRGSLTIVGRSRIRVRRGRQGG